MSAVALILVCVAALLASGIGAVVLARSRRATPIVYGAACVASAVALLIALGQVISAPAESPTIVLPLGLPWLGAHFRIDALSSLFLVIVNLGGAAASLYGIGYGRHESAPARVLPFFPAFLAGMNLVVLAGDAFSFLLSWEFMSLVSWALVMAHHRDPENTRAGYIYLIVASFGTLCLLLAFGLLAGPSGGYGFDAICLAPHSSGLAALILALVLLGAGSKAGLVPLHVWLPLAHPAAPSHVSALMSGVMTKVAIYGFIRIVFDLLGPPEWWWAMVLLFFGGISALIGILFALMQQDLKRLLAYSTIENIGIIFIGLGLALGFGANAMEGAAALALTAALFHVFNHALFKSLLFLGAGAILNATGLRDLDKMGGLIHRMPVTAFAFLAGAVAISALPPLNGFVSEWLTFQAVLFSPELPQWGLKVMVPTAGAHDGAVGGPGRRLLRQGVRHRLPGPRALHHRRRSAGGRPLLAGGDAGLRRFVRAGGAAARLRDRRHRAGCGIAGGRAPAGPGHPAVALHRAGGGGAQLLQRPAGVRVHRRLGLSRHRADPPLRDALDPPRAAVGLRISRSQPDHAI